MDEEKILFDLPKLSVAIKYKTVSKNTKLRSLHLHKAVEVVKVLSGKIECTVNNQSFTLLKDNIFIINSSVPHKIIGKADNSAFIYMQIDLDKYCNALFLQKHNYIFSFVMHEKLKGYSFFENSDDINMILNGLKKELDRKNSAYESYIKAYIYMFIAFMCRNGMLYDFESVSNKSFEKILPIIEYIETNLSNKITLDDLSRYLNADKFNICKLFKSVSGETLTNYINNRRISCAEEMLLSTNKTISEIALECGFNSQQYFNLVFNNKLAMSPSTYRKLKKEI